MNNISNQRQKSEKNKKRISSFESRFKIDKNVSSSVERNLLSNHQLNTFNDYYYLSYLHKYPTFDHELYCFDENMPLDFKAKN